jgi:hypothetical protein
MLDLGAQLKPNGGNPKIISGKAESTLSPHRKKNTSKEYPIYQNELPTMGPDPFVYGGKVISEPPPSIVTCF